MFTGIIDHCGRIADIKNTANGMQIAVKTTFKNLELGESIAVNGMCLTVTSIQENVFYCDISPESLRVTTAKNFVLDQPVNLERALQPTSRLGGHFVSGHVDQVGYVKSIEPQGEFIQMTFTDFDPLLVIKKGSIAINGVSLTINEVSKTAFSVMLIPHTLEQTQLKFLRKQDAVNLEFDMMARIIAEQTKHYRNIE